LHAISGKGASAADPSSAMVWKLRYGIDGSMNSTLICSSRSSAGGHDGIRRINVDSNITLEGS
jgi:hypothetical protein